MKVLHLDTEKGLRGGEQQVLYLAQGLKEHNIDSLIVCTDELYNRAKDIGFEALNLKYLKDYITLIRLAKTFDIIHAHSAKAHTLGVILKLVTGKPLVYTRRVDYTQKRLSKLKYLLTDRVVSISQAIKDILLQRFNVDSKVIYSAVDLNLINQVDKQKVASIRSVYKPPLIVNIGALTEQKDHKTLVCAASMLGKNATFLVLGEGKLRSELENYVIQKGLQKNFFFLGFKKDIQNYLAAMDVFVISSVYEGLCSSILQAFLFKKPVVATNVGGIPELLGKNERGIIVSPKNPKILAQSIEQLLDDSELAKILTQKAYDFVQNFSYQKMTLDYISLYKDLLEKGLSLKNV